jgi:sugar O-acyltransferase (sialic acid O-acetyltransferase NeuD family)
MSKRLVIVGAGGFGRELHSWVNSSPEWRKNAAIAGVVFVDDDTPRVPVRAPIVSTVHDYIPEADDVIVCAIGSPQIRKQVVETLARAHGKFATFIHDRAVVGDNVIVGEGTVICADVLITCDVTMGSHVQVNAACAVGHDVTIGDFVTMSSACNLTGNVEVEELSFLGTAVCVTPGRRISAGAFVGAGSVVVKDVPSGVTVFGNPSVVVGRKS